MTNSTYISPDQQALNNFLSSDDGLPLNMLNLIRFHDIARYPANHGSASENISGEDAYRRYLKVVKPLLDNIDAKIIFFGKPNFMLIGPQERLWDIAMIVNYPSLNALSSILHNANYQSAVIHREVAIADFRLIRMAASDSQEGFNQFLGN